MITIHHGHVIDQLRLMKPESVHAVITSPPYWALRDYKIPAVEWADGWVGQLGLEPTPEQYVTHMVEVFRSIHRVLRKDGVVWLVINDCYVKGKSRAVEEGDVDGADPLKWSQRPSFRRDRRAREDDPKQAVIGLKPKDLVGIPWRVAFGLQADGWWLRSDNVWEKLNVLPETAPDRCVRSHEYVFMLTKSYRYFWDRFAIREAASKNTHARGKGVTPKDAHSSRPQKSNSSFHAATSGVTLHRNKRSVWRIPTQAYKGKHFATFPERLVEPMVLSSTSAEGCCEICYAPLHRRLRRVSQTGVLPWVGESILPRPHKGEVHDSKWIDKGGHDLSTRMAVNMKKARAQGGYHNNPFPQYETIGWKKTCDCMLGGVVPAVVLDPFGGKGTVGRVAERHGRDAVLVELSDQYVATMRMEIPDAK